MAKLGFVPAVTMVACSKPKVNSGSRYAGGYECRLHVANETLFADPLSPHFTDLLSSAIPIQK
jgi:hypothetical protein